MLGLYAIFETLILIIWLIDILNIDFIVNGIYIAYFLDKTIPINTLFWLLLWLFMPHYCINKKILGEDDEDF